jgi:hypothetical protein
MMISLIIIVIVLLYSIDNVYCFHNKLINKPNSLYSSTSISSSNNRNNDLSIKTNMLIIPLMITSIFTPNIAFAKVNYY